MPSTTFVFLQWNLTITLFLTLRMDFQQQLASELRVIIEDLDIGDCGRGSESTALKLESLIETALLNGDISLESVDLMNQARQQLLTASYGERSFTKIDYQPQGR